VRVWEGDTGRHRGGIESVCARVWEGERGRQREEVESECVSVWEGERGRHIGGVRKCVWEGERARHTKEIESVRSRECKIKSGAQREVNVEERGRCRKYKGEIVAWGERERDEGGDKECVRV
jgi:hypothetical protein